jgi:hypothetical protein
VIAVIDCVSRFAAEARDYRQQYRRGDRAENAENVSEPVAADVGKEALHFARPRLANPPSKIATGF